MSNPNYPAIILVHPQLVENIGMVARAMANCALPELRVVNPRDAWPLGDTHRNRMLAAASGANYILDNARSFASIEEATADITYLYATTARSHDITGTIITAREAAPDMKLRLADGHRIGVLFGPERTGLLRDHVAQAAMRITIPLNPDFMSLNLAQSVLLIGYEWHISTHDAPLRKDYTGASRPATREEYNSFLSRLDKALDDARFFTTNEMRPAMRRNLHMSLTRATMTEQELRTWHGVLTALMRKNAAEI